MAESFEYIRQLGRSILDQGAGVEELLRFFRHGLRQVEMAKSGWTVRRRPPTPPDF